jgi:hypothetical protein
MPCYDLRCVKCRQEIRDAVVPFYLSTGDQVPGRECPLCKAPLVRTGGDVPARFAHLWAMQCRKEDH